MSDTRDIDEWVDDPDRRVVDPDEQWEEVDDWGRVLDDGADDYVRVPKEPSRGRRVLWVLGTVALLLVLLLGGVWFWVNSQINPSGPQGDLVEVEVPEGATITALASDLEERGIIGNALVFRFYARRQGFEDVQAGTYDNLFENSSMGEVIAAFEEGPSAPPAAAQITFVEGLRLSELPPIMLSNLTEFDEAELATALTQVRSEFLPPESTNLEGFLFPDTYRIEEGDEADEQALLQQMVERFDAVATEAGYRESESAVGLTPYQLVIVASIIEREAKVAEDRPKVARVIYNRLAQGIPLGIDATLLYAIGHKETLTESDLATDTPYNTRLYPGLPPTPIAMPSQESIEAAINPEPGPWLYYVLIEDDRHFFTDDFDEFNRVAQESRDAGIFE
jgi:UPF0755 protein